MKALTITKQITDRSDEVLRKYFNEVSKIDLLSNDEEFELGMKVKSGDIAAREKLAKANLRFVISVAKQYPNKGVKLIDLISAGNRGLYECVGKYDPELGNKFISYAVWSIRARILEALSKDSRTIRIPAKKGDELRKIKKLIESLEQSLEREPSFDEIYESLGSGYTEKELRTLLNSDKASVSSYDHSLMEDGCPMIDSMSDNTSHSTDHLLKDIDVNNRVSALLKKLTERERNVIVSLYGIGCDKMSIDCIAERWSVTPASISRNRDRALFRMRRLISREGLENFFKTLEDE